MRSFTIVSMLTMGWICFAFSQNAEEEAIKKVIIKEVTSAIDCDAEEWASTMLPADHTVFAVTNYMRPGTAAVGKGISFIENMKKHLNRKACSDGRKVSDVEFDNWNIQIRGEVAWAAYREHTTMVDDTEIDAYVVKILEKREKQWRISAITAVWDFGRASKEWDPQKK